MSWQYSDPLNGALLAAQQNNQSSDLGQTSLYQPLFNKFDPLYPRYQPRVNFLDKTPASINIFDDIDDFDLEVETDNILSARYRVPVNNVYKQPSYVPSSFFNSNNASLNIEQEERNLSNRSLNNIKSDQLPLNKVDLLVIIVLGREMMGKFTSFHLI